MQWEEVPLVPVYDIREERLWILIAPYVWQ